MIHINRQDISVPGIFFSDKIDIAKKRIKDFYNRREKSRSQERFSKAFEPDILREIRAALEFLFKSKCAYCESVILKASSLGVIDNFRPKNGARGLDKEFSNEHYWWLAYEWNNHYYSCQICNRYKSTWFPVEGQRCSIEAPYEMARLQEKNLLIDPCNEDPSEHLIFKENGEVDFLSAKGRATIEILKLNRLELVDARNDILKSLYGDWEEFLKIWRQQEQNWDRIQEISRDWATILNRTSTRPYTEPQQQMLSKWLRNHLDIQDFIYRDLYNNESESGVFSGNVASERAELKEEERKTIKETLNIEAIKHVYLDKIELRNFKCFSYLELKLPDINGQSQSIDENQTSEPWLLFLGENGVGKSSVLKAIAIALMGSEYKKKLGDEISSVRLLKYGADSGYIKLYLKGDVNPIEVHFSRTTNEITTTHHNPITYLVGYGSIRLLPNKKIQPEKGIFEIVKTGNLFDYSIALTDAASWLFKLNQKAFDRTALVLKDLMLLNSSDRLERNKDNKTICVVSDGNSPVAIEELSDGYKTVFALVVDIMATLASEKVSYDLAEGIVLIDEIGTHLHPRWKMEVVGRLRRCFPRIQFIVTTHEPLCLRGLKESETVVLAKNIEKEIIAITDLPNPSELRIDQILTSEFFGLKSAIDPETEAIFEEYYAILALDENERSDDQKKRLLQLNEVVPKMKHLGDNLREELIYYVIDELLARKIRNDGLKIREDLKQEVINRVESLWKLASIENFNKL